MSGAVMLATGVILFVLLATGVILFVLLATGVLVARTRTRIMI